MTAKRATAYTELRSCTGKHKFTTMQAAQLGMASMRKIKKTGGKITAYKCPFCDGYHWGHRIRD